MKHMKKDHILAACLDSFANKWNKWECSRKKQEIPIQFGASFLLAAKKTPKITY